MNRLVVALAVLGACGHMGAAPRPLYEGPALAASETASLSGPVSKVDGVDVSRQGTSFTLLPGCHVVTLQSQIGEGGVSGAWSADIRAQVYAFRMRAGRGYSIDVRLLPGNHSVGTANVGSVEVTAIEQNGQGRKLVSIAPVRSQADIEACQAWAARELGPPEPASAAAPEAPAAAPEAPAATPEAPAAAPEAAPVAPGESADAPAENPTQP